MERTDFELKADLMIHRKSEHKNIVAMCRNNLVGKCSFSADLCWWSHKEGSEKDIECYFCDDKFESRALVMMHRRKEHLKTVKSCTQFLNSKCTFGEQSCWFSHEGKASSSENSDSVFRVGSANREPPLGSL